ncbi:MAG: pteridine reductase [Methylacidiphilales bacterium]|nr:pteridine reductase [Candidatus Methylacidiphilales bacterium]
MKFEKVMLITGGAKRIGKALVEHFHQHGYRVCFSYATSHTQATELSRSLNDKQPNSVIAINTQLQSPGQPIALVDTCLKHFKRLDLVINCASSFFPTPIGTITRADWDELMDTNCYAPLCICQHATEALLQTKGSIINIIDIHAFRPMPRHVVYSITKASLLALTQSLAIELSPNIRVNAIAPGTILWAEHNQDPATKPEAVLPKIPLNRLGTVEEVAQSAYYLAEHATYTTGQVIALDGGRHLQL